MNNNDIINYFRFIRLISDDKNEIALCNFMIENLKDGITPMPSP